MCLNIPEVEGKNETAFSPDNAVPDYDVGIFTQEDCQGEKTVVGFGEKLGPEAKFKSIIVAAHV